MRPPGPLHFWIGLQPSSAELVVSFMKEKSAQRLRLSFLLQSIGDGSGP